MSEVRVDMATNDVVPMHSSGATLHTGSPHSVKSTVQPVQEALTLQGLSLNVEFAFERHKLYACIGA